MIEETYLYQEIHEQPEVAERLLTREKTAVDALATEIKERGITNVVIAARGTSDNAARYAKYLFGAFNGFPVSLATPSLYTIYQKPPKFDNSLVLGISQSGKSPDIVSVVNEARSQRALTASITNFPESDLGKAADYVINLHAGQERSVAATKTYTNELTAIAMLASQLAPDEQNVIKLTWLPDHMATTLTMEESVRKIVPRYRDRVPSVVIGRGYNYATAFELSLKLKELTYTVVEPYSSADFLHGPFAMIERGFPVIVIAPSGAMIPDLERFINALIERNAELIIISDLTEILREASVPLRLPVSVPEWLSPIVSIVPGQLFAMLLAYDRGYDIDQPRGLRKVTETR